MNGEEFDYFIWKNIGCSSIKDIQYESIPSIDFNNPRGSVFIFKKVSLNSTLYIIYKYS